MFPLYDSSPRSTFPIINYLIIAVNIIAFIIQFTSVNFDAYIYQYGFIPAQFEFADVSSYISILTSIFMHGGLMHIISNLWFLHIFGDNVEDHLGHLRYLGFYLAAGVVATFTQYLINTDSVVPHIGASGAISGVAGTYFILFRNSRIKSFLPLGITWTTAELPVWFFLGYWFVLQIFSGINAYVPSSGDGVAWFAHIGGFIFGLLVGLFLKKKDAIS